MVKVGGSSYIFDILKDYFSGRNGLLMAENRSAMISVKLKGAVLRGLS